MRYFWRQWGLRWQRKYPQLKTRKSFLRNFSVMCEFFSESYTYVSCNSPLSVFLRKLRRTSLDRIEAYADKGNIISSKGERSCLRDCYLMCDFITQSSTIPFLEQFANTVVLDSSKWYLGAHWVQWWKRKSLQLKPGKKPSGKMHFDIGIQLTELHLSLQWSVC